MRTKKCLFVMLSLVILFCFSLSGYDNCAASVENKIKAGEFVIEPPTLIALGFEWYVKGDANHNAIINVSYRKKRGRRMERCPAPSQAQRRKDYNSSLQLCHSQQICRKHS